MIMLTDGVLPVKIRENVVVAVAHLPHDLTKAEAEKISRVILSLVSESKGGSE